MVAIKITPRQFGGVAAAAIARGLDVTTYLVRSALADIQCGREAVKPAKKETAPERPVITPADLQREAAESARAAAAAEEELNMRAIEAAGREADASQEAARSTVCEPPADLFGED